MLKFDEVTRLFRNYGGVYFNGLRSNQCDYSGADDESYKHVLSYYILNKLIHPNFSTSK